MQPDLSAATSGQQALEPEVETEPELRPRLAVIGEEPEASALDSHCHLFLMQEDPGEIVRKAREAGVDRLVCVGIDPATSRKSLEFAESFRGVFATAGMHPHTASDLDRAAGSVLEELVAHPMVIAVGETGLDYFRRLSPPEDQRRAFRTHLALARESAKPVVVHVRDAWEDAMALLEEEGAERVVLHCFSGDEEIAREADRRGYFVSFACNVTYPKAQALRRAAVAVGESRLLAETDSPFLPPQALRGKENSPANLTSGLAKLAELRGLDLHQMVASATRAALGAFPAIR